jgi:hypothetical protein
VILCAPLCLCDTLIQLNWVILACNFNPVNRMLINHESSLGAILLIALYFIYLLSSNHKCTQPCYFPLLLKLAAQKEMVDWNSLTRSSRLCAALVAVLVVLWSLPLFRFARELR